MTNKDWRQRNLLRKCRKAKRQGLKFIKLKITNKADVAFLRNYYMLCGCGNHWYMITL